MALFVSQHLVRGVPNVIEKDGDMDIGTFLISYFLVIGIGLVLVAWLAPTGEGDQF